MSPKVDKAKQKYYNFAMTKLLLKLFVKNYKDVGNDHVRESYGKLSGIVGILLNLLLAVGKILVGALFGLISVTADGLNNLTDCGSNLVSLISFKLSNKPADKEHPYGHARIEYVSSMIVAFIILMVAFELAKESVGKILNPEQMEFSWAIVIVLAVSVLAKLWLFVFNRKLGNKIGSTLLKATATDSLSDSIATTVVLISVFVSRHFNIALDGYMGCLVAVVIAIAGINVLKDTMNDLLGKSPEPELIKQIHDKIMSYKEVYGVHDLAVHNYGANKYFASVHVEVDADVPVMESHDVIDLIERDFAQTTNVELVIHLDPIAVNDPETKVFRKRVDEMVKAIDPTFNIHDFRMVKGVTHTNLIFDVAVPFESKLTLVQVKEMVENQVRSWDDGDFYAVVTVENQL